MATNKFDVTFSFFTRNGIIGGRNPIPGLRIEVLPHLGKFLFLSRKMYIVAYGDMDMSTIITRTNQDFNTSCFSRLILCGDFRCSKYSKVFPASVKGCFDCSQMDKDYIDENFRFPITKTINVSHSIKNLDVLIGLLPEDLETLIVDSNFIKKDFVLNNIDSVIKFMETYPDVSIIDKKGKSLKHTADEIIANSDYQKKVFTEYKQKEQEFIGRLNTICDKMQQYINKYPEKNQAIEYYARHVFYKQLESFTSSPDKLFELSNYFSAVEATLADSTKFFKALEQVIKTDEIHLDAQEIFASLRPEPEFNALSDEYLKRLIQQVLSDDRSNQIKKQTLHRLKDDTDVVCIFVSQLPQVRTDLSNLIQAIKTKAQENPEDKIPQNKNVTTVAPTTTQSIVRPIEIKKYIKNSQYKELEKSSGKQNATDALKFINEINCNPLEMQFQGSVQIIKEQQTTVSKTAKKEFGCSIVQSIDSSNHNDNKRLIWQVADGPEGLILVCVAFVKAHDRSNPKQNRKYNDLLKSASKKQMYTESDLTSYVEVADILKSNDDKTDTNSGSGFNFSGYANTLLTQSLSRMDTQR